MQTLRRAGQGAGSVYQRSEDGLWVARLMVNSKPQYRYGKTKKEAAKLLDQMKLELATKTFVPSDKITLGQWLREWLETYKKPKLKPSTFRSYDYIVRLFDPIADMLLQDIADDSDTLQKFFNKQRASLASSTVSKMFIISRQAFEKARKAKKIQENPAELCEVHLDDNKMQTILTPEQVAMLLAAAGGKRRRRIHLILSVAVYTGARQGEILALKWGDIDFESKTIYIDQNLCCIEGERLTLSVKNGRARWVTAHDNLFAELEEYKKSAKFAGDDDFIFCTEEGRPLLARNVSRDWYHVRDDAGIKCRFHDLRHTYASHLYNLAGAQKNDIGFQIGHVDQRSTDRYVKQEVSDRNKAFAKKVGDAYKFPPPKKKK